MTNCVDNIQQSVEVFLGVIPDTIEMIPLTPNLRWREIQECGNEQVKREKYCVWKLLGYALKTVYNVPIEEISFKKENFGGWTSDKCFFSISHSHGVVAVALSENRIGLDVEIYSKKLEGIKEKFLTKVELGLFEEFATENEKKNYLVKKWTEKESIFKKSEKNRFYPSKIQTCEHKTQTNQFSFIEKDYFVTIATDDCADIKWHVIKEYV